MTVDPMNRFAEASDTDNQAWDLLHLDGGSVTVLDRGRDARSRHLPPSAPEPAP